MTDDDAIQQIRLLCAQLQSLQERTSLRDIAASTIAQLVQYGSVVSPQIMPPANNATCNKATNTNGLLSCNICLSLKNNSPTKQEAGYDYIDEETDDIAFMRNHLQNATNIHELSTCIQKVLITNPTPNSNQTDDDQNNISDPGEAEVTNNDEQIMNVDNKIAKLVVNLSDRTKYTKEVSV